MPNSGCFRQNCLLLGPIGANCQTEGLFDPSKNLVIIRHKEQAADLTGVTCKDFIETLEVLSLSVPGFPTDGPSMYPTQTPQQDTNEVVADISMCDPHLTQLPWLSGALEHARCQVSGSPRCSGPRGAVSIGPGNRRTVRNRCPRL